MIDSTIVSQLATKLGLEPSRIEAALILLDEGATIPFVARYRREQTGGLSDTELLAVTENYEALLNFAARQKTILKEIASQEKLTPELEDSIRRAKSLAELEDLYRPFKPKRVTRGSKARAAGLEPLAARLLAGGPGADELAASLAAEGTPYDSPDKVWRGALDIVAEDISDRADIRAYIKKRLASLGRLTTELADSSRDPRQKYREYYQKNIALKDLKTYAFLAIKRAEKEGVVKLRYLFPDQEFVDYIAFKTFKAENPYAQQLKAAAADSYQRLIKPSVTNDVDSELFRTAEDESLTTFKSSLLDILMKPPYQARVILGFDPGFHHGCKLAVIDSTGRVLATDVIHPTVSAAAAERDLPRFGALLDRWGVEVIALGNGTASREAEDFLRRALASRPRIQYEIVSEDGASIYSVTKLAQDEFPDFDPNLRSAISIARRLLDPLSELVKIDPSGLGVGQYQHDVDPKRLKEALEAVVVNAVNRVGVDVNTASLSLLTYISGISKGLAAAIVEHIRAHGRISSRAELRRIKGFGPQAFQNAAGFLRVEGPEPFDRTSVHPESYELARRLLEEQKIAYPAEKERLEQLSEDSLQELSLRLSASKSQLADIARDLARPSRDPRGFARPSVRDDKIRAIEDLKVGMVLSGTIANVTDFGAFVDLGVHVSGLIHISEIADTFVSKETIRSYLRVGDVKKVRVIGLDLERQRISLSLKTAGYGVK